MKKRLPCQECGRLTSRVVCMRCQRKIEAQIAEEEDLQLREHQRKCTDPRCDCKNW